LANPDGWQISSWILSDLLSIIHGGLIILRGKSYLSHRKTNFIRRVLPLFFRAIKIPANIVNVYDIQKYVIEQFFRRRIDMSALPDAKHPVKKIAFHPSAGLMCKRWPWQNWVQLAQRLAHDIPVIVFCAPQESVEVENAFASILGDAQYKLQIRAYGLQDFLFELETVDLLVCLDSMAAHAGYYKQVPAVIVLNGVQDPRYYTPPGALTINGKPTQCPRCPCLCHENPVCEGTDFEHACMKAITVAMIQKAIVASINGSAI
jgi:ADP-heptose:LPS heptosyltransferase